MTDSSEKLAQIRTALLQNSVDAYLIPLSDPHLGENIPDHWKIISWLTGFTGSSATVVITADFAGLWTDSRYFIQAEKELKDSGFVLLRPEAFIMPDFISWLEENIESGSCLAFDGRLVSVDLLRKIRRSLKSKSVTFNYDFDPVSGIWTDRPPLPHSHAWDLPLTFAGRDRSLKIADLRMEMKKQSADYHLIASPDDIMWLLNIRGGDVQYTPLLMSFAVAGMKQVILFADEKKIPHDLAADLDRAGVMTLPYDETAGMISTLPADSSILIDTAKTTVALFSSVPESCRIIEGSSIPARLKSVRNRTEIENLSKVMVRDGAALTRFFYFIETNVGIVPMTEMSLSVKLMECRSEQKDFLGPSFSTITAFNDHAALPHYSPSPETDAEIGENGILLVDSGGQYLGGTTDLTRTISTGTPALQQKKDFTLVLKGHINLALARFPLGTKGYQIDHLARKPLWDNGLDYGHGTGHGVGYCLNVHEGPQNISPAANKTIIEPGMVLSNEPAIYRENEYGIRTENIVLCYEDEETDYGKFLKFDTISLCYIDKNLIDKSLLDKREIDWINSYHEMVFTELSPYLNPEEKEWLRGKTEPL